MKITKKIGIVCFILSSLALASCSTVKGFGQDVSKTGHEISKAAS